MIQIKPHRDTIRIDWEKQPDLDKPQKKKKTQQAIVL